MPKLTMPKFWQRKPAASAPSAPKTRITDDVMAVITDPVLRWKFLCCCCKNFCASEFLFCCLVEQFRTADSRDQPRQAILIADLFFNYSTAAYSGVSQAKSVDENIWDDLNVSAPVRKSAGRNVATGHYASDVFNEAYDECNRLLKTNNAAKTFNPDDDARMEGRFMRSVNLLRQRMLEAGMLPDEILNYGSIVKVDEGRRARAARQSAPAEQTSVSDAYRYR